MTVGQRIKRARKAKNLSQKELAEKLEVTASMIGQYENDLRNPKTSTLKRIADALDIHPADLDESLRIHLGTEVMVEIEKGVFSMFPSESIWGRLGSLSHSLGPDGMEQLAKAGQIMVELDEESNEEFIRYGEYLVIKRKEKSLPQD